MNTTPAHQKGLHLHMEDCITLPLWDVIHVEDCINQQSTLPPWDSQGLGGGSLHLSRLPGRRFHRVEKSMSSTDLGVPKD